MKKFLNLFVLFIITTTFCIGTPDAKIKKDLKIDINTASVKMLIKLPGIGRVKAKRIVEYRKKDHIDSLTELLKIKGITKKTVEKIRPYVMLK